MKYGLNLYSIRNKLETEESFLEAAKELKEMGYSYIQYSGGEFDPDRIERVSKAVDMPVVLTHVPLDRIVNDTEKLMEEHDKFGCKYIGLGAMGREAIYDKAKCFQTIEDLNKAGEKMAANGFKFFYHHHHYEFYKHDGKTIFDHILEKAPYINFTMDTYWLQYGGVDMCDTLDKAAGRMACLHLKDYMIAKTKEEKLAFAPVYAPVGDGTIDFKKAIDHARAAGCEYFLVEQDNAALLPDTMEQVARSARYLSANF